MDPERRPALDPRKVAGYGFIAAMVAAPFFALLYGWTWALGVMTLALAATTALAYDAMRAMTDPALRARLRLLALINGVLALAGLVTLLLRLG